MDTKVEGFDCRLHARMDSEMRYMKEKVDQGMQLLVTRIDGEVKVINDRTEHVRQATSCLDDALCRLDAKLDATVSALDKQINQLAQALDDQLSSVVDQVDGRPVEHFSCVFNACLVMNRLALPRPTAAPTAALALQRRHRWSHCHLALLI